jgi:hypothetical protein
VVQLRYETPTNAKNNTHLDADHSVRTYRLCLFRA